MKSKKIKGYKMFNSDFTCQDMQYEVGKSYKVKGNIKCCDNGLHFCPNPFNCLDYYPLINSNGEFNKFAEVVGGGEIDKQEACGNVKIAVSNLDVIKELTLSDFVNEGIKFIQHETKMSNLKNNNGNSAKIGSSGDSAKIGSSGDYAQIGSSGNYAQIGSSGNDAQIGSSGDSAQIGSSGNYAQIGSSGYYAKIGSSGYSAKIGSSGNYAQIGSSGDSAQIGSSGYSAKIGSSGNYAQIGSSGYSAKIGSSGNYAQIGSSGDYAKITSSGEDCVICCAGNNSMARGKKGSWITLSEWKWDDKKKCDVPVCVKTKKIDGKTIKEDTFYKLKDGKLVEVSEE